jgi:hypothetical protein
MKTQGVTFILLASLTLLSNLQPALCGPANAVAKKTPAAHGVQTPQSDVVVTKNADETVEVGDAPAGSGSAASGGGTQGGGGIKYKAAPPATIKYGDGVVVHRNPDGSVDVEDEDSAHPVYHSFGSAPAATQAHHHASSHGGKTGSKAPAKKTK